MEDPESARKLCEYGTWATEEEKNKALQGYEKKDVDPSSSDRNIKSVQSFASDPTQLIKTPNTENLTLYPPEATDVAIADAVFAGNEDSGPRAMTKREAGMTGEGSEKVEEEPEKSGGTKTALLLVGVVALLAFALL